MSDLAVARPRLTRAAVVGAAADFADLRGLDELTLTRVAEALGVSLPALYNHVRSHSDCTAAMAVHGLDALTERLHLARGQGVQAARDEAVRAVAHEWRAFARQRPGLYSAIHRHRWSRSREQIAASERLLTLLRSVVLSYRSDLSDPADPTDAAWAIGSALHGFVATEAEGAAPVGRDLGPAFAQLVEVLCAGLRAAPAPAPTHP